MKKRILRNLKMLGTLMLTIPFVVNAAAIDSIDFIDKDGTYDIIGKIGEKVISSTYDENGYQSYLRVDEGEEVEVGDLEETIVDDVKLEISHKKSEDGSQIFVTYKVTNNSDTKKLIDISSGADIDLGLNDEAAISKNGTSSFTITQDSKYIGENGREYNLSECGEIKDEYEKEYCEMLAISFASQFKILMQPAAKTSWIGGYSERYDNKYNNSEALFYTRVDELDTGLIYNWEDELEAGETKEYVAIFSIIEAETVNVKFHKFDKTINERSGLLGGAITFPEISIPQEEREEGFLYRWCANSNGQGACYKENAGIVLQGESDFYEVKKDNYGNPIFEIEDEEIEEENEEETEEPEERTPKTILDILVEGTDAYDFYEYFSPPIEDVSVILEVEDCSEILEAKDKNLINTLLEEEEKIGIYLDAELFLKIYGIQVNITEVTSPIKISFTVPENLRGIKKYSIIRLHNDEVEKIPATYDEETNLITFSTDKFSIFALVIEDEEIEQNPETRDNILTYVLISIVSIVAIVLVALKLKKSN